MLQQLSVQPNLLPRNFENSFDDGYLRIEFPNYYVSCGNFQIKLNKIEFEIVSLLAKNIGSYIAPEVIWQKLWTNRTYNFESLKVRICRLRHKLSPYGIQIETKMNVGYRLNPETH